jgi:hypothetical protein
MDPFLGRGVEASLKLKKKKKSVFAEGARLRTRKESEKKKRWVDSVSLGFDSEFGL